MRVLIGWFGHETNTFSKRKTDFELLISQGFWEGEDLISTFTGTPSYVGGMIKFAIENNIHLIPTIGVENAGATLEDRCLNHVVQKIIFHIKKNKGQFDGICLGLHGAGCSQSCRDIESYTLEAIRQVVGQNIPITITLDLHGNVSKKMCRLSTGLFGIKENPHTDYEMTGYEAMSALSLFVRKDIKFQTALIKLPLLMPLTANTSGVYRQVTDYIKTYKKKNNLLDAAFFPGFPYADHPDIRSSVFVTATEKCEEHAQKLANYIWSKRRDIVPKPELDVQKAVKKAKKILKTDPAPLIVINEMSDNPGGGGPGDGTYLLRAMRNANIKNSAFGYIYDPEVVKYAMKKGIGSKINVLLGGKLEDEKFHGKPLHIKNAEICTLSNGNMIATTPLMAGIPGSFGNTVTLKTGQLKIVIASVANQTYDDRIFFVGGIDIRQMSLLGLKSSQHFRAFYDTIATDIIPADPIGIVTSDLSVFEYKNIGCEVYPLKEDVAYTA